jgi:thiamine biosynthesis lipoprotein ApbE
LLSLTIAGPSLAYADAYSTAGFAMGRPGIEWMATLDQYSGFAITTDHRAVWSDGFGQLLDVR